MLTPTRTDAPFAPPEAGAPKVSHVLPLKTIRLRVNGIEQQLAVEPWVTLLDLLRERLELTGTKKGCDHGQCGACTVLVDGKRINSCLTFAVMRDGADVTTVEGLPALAGRLGEGALHPLQEAFMAHDAFQCGYCTPGQLCSAAGLLNEGRASGPNVIRELMSGNICRCGAYPQILRAVAEVALASPDRRAPGRRRRPAHEDLRLRDGRRAGRGDRSPRRLSARQCHRARAPKFIAGGTNLIDLMKADVMWPPLLVDVNALQLAAIDDTEGGGVRLGALARNADTAYHPIGPRALPAAVGGHPRRRIAADPQHGEQRRQPAAAHPLLLLLRHRRAVQQARARHGLPRDRRAGAAARHSRHQRALHRDPPFRHVRGAGGARGDGAGALGGRRTLDPVRRVSSPARATGPTPTRPSPLAS